MQLHPVLNQSSIYFTGKKTEKVKSVLKSGKEKLDDIVPSHKLLLTGFGVAALSPFFYLGMGVVALAVIENKTDYIDNTLKKWLKPATPDKS